MSSRSSEDVGRYYDQAIQVAAASGAGLIWFMGRDHLSPPMLNLEAYAMDANRWRDATSERVLYLARRMGITHGDSVLDLGTGIGGPGHDVMLDSGARLYGVNISGAQIENIRARSIASNVRYRAIEQADMQALPFSEGQFDHIFSINAIYHVSDFTAVIQEASRVLRKGGKFGVDDWFTTNTTTPEEYRKLRYNWSTSVNGFHNFDEFKAHMEEAGFRVEVMDFTREAGEFICEERFGKVYDEQVAPVLLEAFPKLYQYEGYEQKHAELAVAQLRADILYMGELYRSGHAVYRQIIGEKV